MDTRPTSPSRLCSNLTPVARFFAIHSRSGSDTTCQSPTPPKSIRMPIRTHPGGRAPKKRAISVAIPVDHIRCCQLRSHPHLVCRSGRGFRPKGLRRFGKSRRTEAFLEPFLFEWEISTWLEDVSVQKGRGSALEIDLIGIKS